jgi:hypothetical protein
MISFTSDLLRLVYNPGKKAKEDKQTTQRLATAALKSKPTDKNQN